MAAAPANPARPSPVIPPAGRGPVGLPGLLDDRENDHSAEGDQGGDDRPGGSRANHPDQGRSPAEGESDEQAVRDPSMLEHGIADGASEHADRKHRGNRHRGEHHPGTKSTGEPGDGRHRLDEVRVDAGREKHGASRDPGHEIRKAHEHPADAGADEQDSGNRRRRWFVA